MSVINNLSGGNVNLTNTQSLVDRLGVALGAYPYKIISGVTNGTISGDTAISTTATVNIIPDSIYTYPTNYDITVTNASVDSYNPETGTLTLSNPTGDVTITAECPKLLDETYTTSGIDNEVVIPKTGTYKLECWGASGGAGNVNGGFGGYSYGEAYLTQGTTLHIYVGGAGKNYAGNIQLAGGYNGGGIKYSYQDTTQLGGSGGGATHIATVSGLLSARSSDYSTTVLMVAGGGGGGAFNGYTSLRYQGGNGGGTSGGNGQGYAGCNGQGGSQSSYGISGNGRGQVSPAGFGYGANGAIAGGGGGLYGGGAGNMNTSSTFGAAGGGSGYLSSSLTNASTINSGTSSSTPKSGYLKAGNGAAHIELLSIS